MKNPESRENNKKQSTEIPKENKQEKHRATAEEFSQAWDYLSDAKEGKMWNMRLIEALSSDSEEIKEWVKNYTPEKNDPDFKEKINRIKTILAIKQNFNKGDKRIIDIVKTANNFIQELKRKISKSILGLRQELANTNIPSKQAKLTKTIEILRKKDEELIHLQTKIELSISDHEAYAPIIEQNYEQEQETTTQEEWDKILKEI